MSLQRKGAMVMAAMLALSLTPLTSEAAPQEPEILASGLMQPPRGKWTLWYEGPSRRWLDALPLGNGHIGAMMFGGVNQERIALNEATMWSGEEYKGETDRGGRKALGAIQAAYLRGDWTDADRMLSSFNQTKEAHQRIGTHLPVGDLLLDFAPYARGCSDYRRELDMERSVARVEFTAGGVHFTREAFVSHPDKVMVVRLAADRKNALTFGVSARQWQPKEPPGQPTVEVQGDELTLSGQALEKLHSAGIYGVHFEVRVKVLAEGGSVRDAGLSLVVDGADAATLLVSITTDFRGFDYRGAGKRRIANAARKTFDQLLKEHVADVQPRFDRVDLTLDEDKGAAAEEPTDRRLKAYKRGADDPALAAQFFQFGRYLTLAGSREDSRLPMPLQGLWSDGNAASMGWSDDYHLDINTQQNYWMAEVGNLSESHLPLMRYIGQLRLAGRQSARNTYGARGWCAHVTANAWAAAPFNHGGAPTCGTWQASHLWEHYAFTGDRHFLAGAAYPILKENAEFYLDTMITDPKTGWRVTCPAYSPENGFEDPVTGLKRGHTVGNTADTEIVYELFRECIEGSRILGIDARFRARLEKAQGELPPLEKLIHQDGRLMEWLEPAFDGAYARSHRHTSHLLGLFPFDQITPDKTPAVARAARATLDDKLKHLEDTEWTRGNYINFFARLRDGDMAWRQLGALFKNWIPGGSLLAAEGNIFCLDGDTAGAAGIAEMLVQSHSGQIELLPALPAAWPNGSARGLRARGGFEVSLAWREGRLTRATIQSITGTACKVRYGGKTVTLALTPGQSAGLNAQLAGAPGRD